MQQQINPLLNQQQEREERRYIEMQKAEALEDRHLPFDRVIRKKKGF
jgi:hypothetical protein